MAILHKHVYERHTPIDSYVSDVPRRMKRIIGRCLAKKPEQRYESMHALKADLERLQRGEREPALSRLRHRWDLVPKRRGALGVALVVTFAATLSLIAAGALLENRAEPLASGTRAEPPAPPSEIGVPDALARPEDEVVGASVDPVSPPTLLARPAAASRPEAPGRFRKSAPKARSKPGKSSKSVQAARQADDVLDPWM